MTRHSSSITTCLAFISLWALSSDVSFAVEGGMVDPEVPATYRLPAVERGVAAEQSIATSTQPLFSSPAPVIDSEKAANQTQSTYVSLPAGTPPDDGRVHATAAGSEAVTAQQSLPAVPPSAPPSEPIQTVAKGPALAVPATTELSAQLLPAVQRGTGLAERGALFAARTEFIQVLRRLAQCKDAAASSDEHSRALAAGLRALDEAEDFVPEGVQLEAEMNVRAVASSHRTPVLPAAGDDVTPFKAVALYHSFAQEKLAKVAAGERAGSMALYGLGRAHARLAEQSDEDVEQIHTAMIMYAAALDACPDNHLAANELGVLICRAGRANEAVKLFQQAIDVSPSATAYHNLAMVQQRMGMHGASAANEQESQRLAAWERSRGDVSRRAGVRWVAAEELARLGQPNQWTVAAANSTPPQTAAEQPSQGKFSISKVFSRSDNDDSNEALQPTSYPHATRPVGHVAGQRRWR